MNYITPEVNNYHIRCSLTAYPGVGKSYTSLLLATRLVDLLTLKGQASGKGILLIDSEFGCSRVYANDFQFMQEIITNNHPNNWVRAINEASEYGFDAIILDSLSQAWIGDNGGYDLANSQGNGKITFSVWAKIAPLLREIMNAIKKSKCKIIIATLLEKASYAIESDDDDRMFSIEKEKSINSVFKKETLEAAFDIMLHLKRYKTPNPSKIAIIKSRLSALNGIEFDMNCELLAALMQIWL